MKISLKICLIALFLTLGTTGHAATTRYIAQTAGTFSGGSVCNGKTTITVATLNSTTMSAGDTNVLCGQVVAPNGSKNYIILGNSGTSGNVISLVFDTGAVLTSGYWSGPAIDVTANYVLINGGTNATGGPNGIIQATANGTGLANQVDGGGCVAAVGSNHDLEIENLNCINLYVRTGTSDTAAQNMNSFQIGLGSGAANLKIHNNIVHDAHWLMLIEYGAGGTTTTGPIQIYNNTLSNMDHGFAMGDPNDTANAHLTSTNCSVAFHDNDVSNMGVWDNPGDSYHHDGAHTWANFTGASYSGVCYYNNYVHGNNGANPSGMLTFEGSNGNGNLMFNNLVDLTGSNSSCADGALALFSGESGQNDLTTGVFNNTVIANPNCGVAIGWQESSGGVMENNIIQSVTNGNGSYIYIANPVTGLTTSDHNIYGTPAGGNPFICSAGFGVSFTTWQTSCGFDANGKNAAITFNSGDTLPSGSPAIGAGANLTSLGITALDMGAPQTFGALGSCGTGCVVRSATTAWDAGAYPFGTTTVVTPPPPPPTPAALVISTASLSSGTVGNAYSAIFSATGGTTPYTWSATGVPTSLTFSTAGVLSGTPSVAATSSVVVTVKDSSSPQMSKSVTLSLLVNPAPIVASPYVVTATPTSMTFSGQAGAAIAAQTLVIDDTTPSYPLPIAITTDQTWLSATTATQTKATVSVSVNTAGMTAGTHTGHVIVTESAAEPNGNTVNNSPLSIPVTLTLTAPPPPTASITCTASLVCTIVTANIPAGTTVTISATTDGVVSTTTTVIP